MSVQSLQTTVNMSGASESQRIAAVAMGLANIRQQHDVLSKASKVALIGAKLHISPVDAYAHTILDGYIKVAKG